MTGIFHIFYNMRSVILVSILLCFVSASVFGQTNHLPDLIHPISDTIVRLQHHYQRSTADGPDPLLFVNGRARAWNEISNLKPKKIISIQVIKDSAAIATYGLRGQYGVVLVKTKSIFRRVPHCRTIQKIPR